MYDQIELENDHTLECKDDGDACLDVPDNHGNDRLAVAVRSIKAVVLKTLGAAIE